MTGALLKNTSNDLANVDVRTKGVLKRALIVSKSGRRLAGPHTDKEDFGLIIGIHPAGHPGKKWIACAGLGEYGTSGAAYFLANYWKDIADKVMDTGHFACIVRVPDGDDSGAHLHRFALPNGRWSSR